jgi:hypothetical protein
MATTAKSEKPIWEPDTKKLRLKKARLSFPVIWEPRRFSEDQDSKYSATFVLPKDSAVAKAAEAAVQGLAVETFKRTEGIKTCLHDGAEKAHLAGFGAGTVYLTASTRARPLVIDGNGAVLAESDGRPYAGCYVTGLVRLWAMNNQFGRRVNAELLGIQFVADGEPFSGGPRAEPDDFEVEGDEEDDWASF